MNWRTEVCSCNSNPHDRLAGVFAISLVIGTQCIFGEIINECTQLTHPPPVTTMISDGKFKKKTVTKCQILYTVFSRVSQIKLP